MSGERSIRNALPTPKLCQSASWASACTPASTGAPGAACAAGPGGGASAAASSGASGAAAPAGISVPASIAAGTRGSRPARPAARRPAAGRWGIRQSGPHVCLSSKEGRFLRQPGHGQNCASSLANLQMPGFRVCNGSFFCRCPRQPGQKSSGGNSPRGSAPGRAPAGGGASPADDAEVAGSSPAGGGAVDENEVCSGALVGPGLGLGVLVGLGLDPSPCTGKACVAGSCRSSRAQPAAMAAQSSRGQTSASAATSLGLPSAEPRCACCACPQHCSGSR